MSRLAPLRRGAISTVASIIAMTALFTASFGALIDAAPSAELFGQLAQIGATLLVAYSVAIVAAERQLRTKSSKDEHEDWLGFSVGAGACGLLGIILAVGLSAHRDAGHANLLDDIGLWWCVSSIGVLGLTIAILPLASYSWRTSTR
jgi:hypothetical protein